MPEGTRWTGALKLAQTHAQCARFDDCLSACQKILGLHADDLEAVLNVGSLLLNFGYQKAKLVNQF